MRVARSFVTTTSLLLSAFAASGAPADGQGLKNALGGDRWQGRLSLTTSSSAPWSSSLRYDRLNGQRVDHAVVLADYYFSSQPAARERTTGFRATGGVGFARRGSAWLGRMPLGAATYSSTASTPDGDIATTSFPYVGIGYSGIYPKSGWGFTADLGMMGMSAAQANGSGLRVDGNNAGSQGNTDTSQASLRMRPVLQVGVSYSF